MLVTLTGNSVFLGKGATLEIGVSSAYGCLGERRALDVGHREMVGGRVSV